jgi:hypothetical protein
MKGAYANMVVDELQVDAGGGIDIWVVWDTPPDAVSEESEVLVTYARGSRMHDWVWASILRPIARELGLQSEVAGLVHGGEDTYTIRTADDHFVEVNGRTHPRAVQLLEAMAAKVGDLAMREQTESPRRLKKRQAM